MNDKAVIEHDTQADAASMAVLTTPADKFITMIDRASTNPDVDVSKMERLWEMSKEMMDRQAVSEYNAGMTVVQASTPAIKKAAKNAQTNSSYAKLENIISAIRPIYTENGFSLSFSEGENQTEGMVRVLLDVSHAGGDVRRFHYDSPMDMTGLKGNVNKTATHGKASAMSYGQRYLTNLIFMLDFSGDDDGNAAGGKVAEKITEEQCLKIESLVSDHDLDSKAFHAFLAQSLGIEHIDEIPTDKFRAVVRKINATIEATKNRY